MRSILCELGPLTIRWYGVMMALGFLAALGNWMVLGRRRDRDAQYCADLMFWIMVSGILGARLAYVLEHWGDYAAAPLSIFRLDEGGLIFYGGFVMAGIAIVLFARRHRESLLPLFDFVLTSVPLAHAFGRIGCFLNGCCFGTCTDLPLGVRFPRGAAAWILHYQQGWIGEQAAFSRSVHPVQLYEAGYNLVIYGLLVWVFRRSPRAGSVSALYLVLYSLGRFVLEFFRGDRGDRLAVGALSIGQFVSLLLLAIGVSLLVGLWVRGRSPETEAV